MARGSRYNIYKNIKTHYKKADYSSNGLASSGNNYDEYIDEADYYVLDTKTNNLVKLALKKKTIKDVFAAEADKVNKFVNDHSSDSIDDMYLEELGKSMNDGCR